MASFSLTVITRMLFLFFSRPSFQIVHLVRAAPVASTRIRPRRRVARRVLRCVHRIIFTLEWLLSCHLSRAVVLQSCWCQCYVCSHCIAPLFFLVVLQGYYCPAGAPTYYGCPTGQYAGGSSCGCTNCPCGQYQNLALQSSCKACPAVRVKSKQLVVMCAQPSFDFVVMAWSEKL